MNGRASDEGPTVADLLGGTFRLLRRGAPRAGIALLILAALGIVIDSRMAGPEWEGLLNLFASVLVIVAQYRVTRLLLGDLAGEMPTGGSIGAFIVLGIMSGLGILLGLLLLVVPGIVLFVRWSIAVPILLDTGDGVTDSLRRSWHDTEGCFWPILVTYLVLYGPAVAAAALGYALATWNPDNLAGVVVANLALNGGLIVGWHAAVAIYSHFQSPPSIAAVFE